MATEIIVSDNSTSIVKGAKQGKNPAYVYLASLSSERSRRVMLNALRGIVAVIHGKQIEDVTADNAFFFQWAELRYEHTQAIRTGLQQNYSYSSVNRMLSALRRVLKECWRLGLMDNETMARACDIENVKGETVPAGRDLAQGEILALVEACNRDENLPGGTRDAALIGVLYTCGIRRAELAQIEIKDLDLNTGAIHILHGKGNKQRTVYATNGTLTALRDWIVLRGHSAGGLFLPVQKGGKIVRTEKKSKLKGITPQTVYDMLKRRAKQAGVNNFTPHDFRRTFVGDLLDRGVDISTVQKMAGHSDVSTTSRYDRRPEEAKLEAAQKLHYPYKKRTLLND